MEELTVFIQFHMTSLYMFNNIVKLDEYFADKEFICNARGTLCSFQDSFHLFNTGALHYIFIWFEKKKKRNTCKI